MEAGDRQRSEVSVAKLLEIEDYLKKGRELENN